MSGERLLVVDDSADTRELLQRNLTSQGYEVLTAADVAEALRTLHSAHIDLVITDLKMPGASGLDLVRHVTENLKDTEVMMITGYPSVEGAVAAIKSGAEEYLSKPFTKEELFAAVARAMDKLNLRQAGRAQIGGQTRNPLGMVGECAAMQEAFRSISKAASLTTPVLITGEDGTGKELLAKAIHYASARFQSPFIAIDCANLPENIIERQLLGHAGDVYGGGSKSRAGFCELVTDGTLYFREITDLPANIQPKLVQKLDEKKFRPTGLPEAHAMDFVVIASSNRDLPELVAKGWFREDLFARLSATTISVPALRQRGNDVVLLAQHFASKFSKQIDKRLPRFSDHALELLRKHPWPGNIAELQNVVRHLVLAADADVIDVPDFPPNMRYSAAGVTGLNRSLAELEAEHIRNVLVSVGSNKTRAAEILGINRKTLREKLRQIGHRDRNAQT